MRILQVNSVYGLGSTGRIAQSIATNLVSHGDESFVAYGRDSASGTKSLIKVGTALDTVRHGLRSRLLDQHGLGSARPTDVLINHIKRLNVDLIHLHNVHGYYLNYERLFGYMRSVGIPVVWTLHDCWAFTGHCAYFTYAECEKWRTHCHACPQKKSYPASLGRDYSYGSFIRKREAFTGQRNLTIVTPSTWLGSLVSDSILREYPRRVIPNDPDFDTFKPTASDWKQRKGLGGKFLVLAVANYWEDRKGLRFLQDLAPHLRSDEVIVVVGNLPRGVQLTGQFVHVRATHDSAELAAVYSACDVFVNPTLEENYPTTNLEAMACGTPVITFDTGGSGETVARGQGQVLTSKSAVALREAIDRLQSERTPPRDSESASSLLPRPSVTMPEQYRSLYQEVLG